MIDEVAFSIARSRVVGERQIGRGIGTLGEKPLHRILKYYIEPDDECHEVEFMRYICDVKNDGGIYEIQTGSFLPLCKKLKAFLPNIRVTVVHPIIRIKKLCWVDRETGEMSSPRVSNKKGKYSDALPELSQISGLLFNENLTVRLILLDGEEFKCLDGYDKTRKKRATKIQIIPNKIVEYIDIKTVDDIKRLVPEELPELFKAKDFSKATGLIRRRAFYALKFLEGVGIVEKTGKQTNAFIYKLKK